MEILNKHSAKTRKLTIPLRELKICLENDVSTSAEDSPHKSDIEQKSI